MPNWGQGFKGAVGGGLAGAGLGGPVGGVIGAVGGGLAGLLGGGESGNDAKHRSMLMDYYNQVGGGRMAPQAGPAAQSGYSGFRANQSDLIGRLEALSRGQGPSLAAQMFRQTTDRNQAQQAGFANSGRGGPLMAMQAANNMSLLGAQASQGAAGARIAEQNMALGHLGQAITAGRGADESTNQFNAGQQNQMALANLEARLKQMGLDDQTRLQILSQLGGQNQAQMNQPGIGDQLMAGGAGLYAFGASQAASNKAAGKMSPIQAPYGHTGPWAGKGGYWTPTQG